jgi:hypothetical protein
MSGAMRDESRGSNEWRGARLHLIESIQRSLAMEIQGYKVEMA